MWHLFFNILRILAAFSGLVLIYAGLFLYENEQGKLQNTLENLWIKIDDQRQKSLSRHTAFMRGIANFTSLSFDRLFGTKLLSLRAVLVSTSYSYASASLMGCIFSYLEAITRNRPFVELATVFIIFMIVFLLYATLGTAPVIISSHSRMKLWVIIAVVMNFVLVFAYYIFYILVADEAQTEASGANILFPAIMAAICLSVCSDFLFIALIRKLLRWASSLDSFYKIAGTVLLNCCIAFLLVFLPYLLGSRIYDELIEQAYTEGTWVIAQKGLHFLSATLVATAMGNLINVLIAIVFIVLAFIMLLHKIFWPLIERPIYALQRLGIVRRNKLTITLGLVLIGVAIGVIPAWLKDVIATFN